ncbi:MAG: prolyl oligopeptidase family serine peptidase, partial [Planctomycetota bacterium]|nr:prolyl oligopeptidase family serine peptidase [Planctomycetota bacterium]
MNRLKKLPLLLSLALLALTFASEAESQDKTKPQTLLEARKGYKTKLIENAYERSGPAKFPPARIFDLVQYPSKVGKLSAYLTPDPKDKKKHPVVIWIGDGFDGLKKSLWEEDTAMLRDAGFLVCCPSFRGENENPGQFELAYGEVDDVVAAVDYVSKLSYVDSKRVYLLGYGRGGTLAMLAA